MESDSKQLNYLKPHKCSRLEQSSVIKLLVAEKYKPFEIYGRIWDVYRESIFTNGLNMDLPLWAWVKKTVHGMETHWLFCKEKVQDSVVSTRDITDSVLGDEVTPYYWFPWKGCNYKQCFLLPIP